MKIFSVTGWFPHCIRGPDVVCRFSDQCVSVYVCEIKHGLVCITNWTVESRSSKQSTLIIISSNRHFLDFLLPVSCQTSQPAAGQEHFRGDICGDSGRLDGRHENLALQGGLLRGQLQLLRHLGQDLHWVRQPQTAHTVSSPAYSRQECLRVYSTPGIWRDPC